MFVCFAIWVEDLTMFDLRFGLSVSKSWFETISEITWLDCDPQNAENIGGGIEHSSRPVFCS